MSSQPGEGIVRRTPAALAIPSDDEIRRGWRVAEALAKSGMFPDARSAEQAFAKMLVGMDLGLSATQALMSIDIVEGRPRIQSVALAGFIRRHPGYDYTITAHDETRCSVELFAVPAATLTDAGRIVAPERESLGTSTFTIEEAQTAGLVKDKSGWKKYPKNMLFARALSNGVKWFAPDLMGGVPVYTEGDEFEARAALTQGSGDGAVQGLDLGPKVEAVLARAAELGHVGLADRASAEMALGGRAPDVPVAWVAAASKELDELEASQTEHEQAIPDVVIVDPTPSVKFSTGDEIREGLAEADATEGAADTLEEARKGGDGE